jgi:hypothetical protein
MIGSVILILLVGWIFNLVGIIPAFNRQVNEFRMALENVGKTVQK